MNTPPKAKPSFAKRNLPLIVLTLGVLVFGLLWGAWQYQARNYAEEVASPLEASLVKAGAVKKCSRGDAGRGTDNNRPWYEVYYELSASREDATKVIYEIATTKGYKLNQATLTDRGPVQVDDAYVNNWFYNTVEKKSPVNALQPGSVELFFTLDNKGPINLSCGTEAKTVTINASADVSMVGIRTKLPEFK